jgi:hypothetical protein
MESEKTKYEKPISVCIQVLSDLILNGSTAAGLLLFTSLE